jgi:hypothetical protein
MKPNHRLILAALWTVAFTVAASGVDAAVSISGIVGASGKFLLTGMPVTGNAPAVLKMTFENRTAGTNLNLCAGTTADFGSGACPINLSSSGGPGFRFLTIVDTATLSGKVLYVKRAVGTTAAEFVLTVE